MTEGSFFAVGAALRLFFCMSTYATTAFLSAYRIRAVFSAFRHRHKGSLPCFGHTALSLSQQFGYLYTKVASYAAIPVA